MSFLFRRHASTISTTTRNIANALLERTLNAPPTIRTQLLDANQPRLLSLTLHRPSLYPFIPIAASAPPVGTPLPPAYHLAYFTPAILPSDLGPDGADISYNPPAPFTRRMWAGGEIEWVKGNLLRVGDEVTEATRLMSSAPKVTRNGEEMIFVRVEKSFENAGGLAVVDRRDWVFRLGLPVAAAAAGRQEYPEVANNDHVLPESEHEGVKARDYLQTPVSLFRFSALTFNAHMIHYSKPWCREVEGHRNVVVHGPLNLINMCDFWRDESRGDGYGVPSSLRYRATAPFYAGEKYRALLEKERSRTAVRLWGSDGKGEVRVGMIGDFVD